MRKILDVVAIVGFIFVIGTVGAGEAGTIGWGQALLQISIGITMVMGGKIYGLFMHQR